MDLTNIKIKSHFEKSIVDVSLLQLFSEFIDVH